MVTRCSVDRQQLQCFSRDFQSLFSVEQCIQLEDLSNGIHSQLREECCHDAGQLQLIAVGMGPHTKSLHLCLWQPDQASRTSFSPETHKNTVGVYPELSVMTTSCCSSHGDSYHHKPPSQERYLHSVMPLLAVGAGTGPL